MTNFLPISSPLVIDAGVAIWAVLPAMATVDVTSMFVQWRQAKLEIYAPSLWLAECTTVIRRAIHTSMLTAEEGQTAIEDLFALDINIIPMTPVHCRAALLWANRLGQSKAYDGFYLALADELKATFVMTDRRLANGAQQKSIDWVKWIGN